MKKKQVLWLSSVANVGLAIVCVYLWKSIHQTSADHSPASGATEIQPEQAATQTPASMPDNQLNWRLVESSEYPTYIKNLRTIGCPEDTVRDIIIADVDQYFTAQFEQNYGPAKEKFWQTRAQKAFAPGAIEARKQFRELEKQKADLIQQLLNVDLAAEMRKYISGGIQPDSRLDFLTPEKQAQVLAVRSTYIDRAQEVMNELGVILFPDEVEKLKQIHAERRDTLLGILTQDEMDELDARVSPSAAILRQKMANFEITPREFRELVQLRRPVDEEFALLEALPYYSMNQQEKEKKVAAYEKLDQQLRERLGPTRFADYVRSQEPYYGYFYQLTKNSKLAGDAFGVRQSAEKRRAQLLANSNLDESGRASALKTLQTETEQSLRQILGEEGLADFNRQTGGWLAGFVKAQ